jgi:cardiolipin synthase
MRLSTVLGSYLDPLADKVLIVSLACALAAKGLLPPWLVGLIIARDGALVVGAFAARAHAQGWRWHGAKEFFRMVPAHGSAAAAAPRVQPLLVSKVNTVAQIALGAAALASDAWGMPGAQAIEWGVQGVAATTVASSAAYGLNVLRGRWVA